MRITIVQGPFLPIPPLMGGAVEKFFAAMGPVWADKGHRVNHISRAYPDLPAKETVDGVLHTRVPSTDSTGNMLVDKFNDFVYADRVLKVLPPSDILISNTFFFPLLASNRLAPVWVHAARFPKGQLPLYHKAAMIQFPSKAVLEAARTQAGWLEDKFCVIPNALPDNPLESLPEAKASRAQVERLLYVGRVHPEKGLHLLLEALLLVPEDIQRSLSLRIVGPYEEAKGGGGQKYLDKLKALANNILTKVDFVGSIFDSAKLREEYAAADLLVYPSLADKGESFGVAPLEALAVGTPALVSSLACFTDFMQHRHNGLIFDHHAPDPVAALAQGLLEARGQEAQWPELAQNALATAHRFTLDKVADMFLDKFEQIVDKHE